MRLTAAWILGPLLLTTSASATTGAPSADDSIRSFHVTIPQKDLDDLKQRVNLSRP